MAPSPAAGKQTGGQPKTPTKLNRKPGATPQKLGQSSSRGAPSTPKAAGAKKPETDSPQLPPRPEGDDTAQDTADTAKGTAEGAEDAGDQAQSNVEMKDEDDDEGPMNKVTEEGDQAQEGLEDAAPKPIDDDDDAVGGAQDQAKDTAEDAGEQAEDVADDATEKAGEQDESQDEQTDDQDQQEGGGLLSGAKGLADKAQGLAGKGTEDPSGTAKDAAGDAKEGAEETAEGAQETAEDGADEAQKVAGETTDEAGDAAEGAEDQAGETAEDAQDEAGEATEDAQDESGAAVDDAKDTAEDTAEGAQDEAGEGVEGAKAEVGEGVEGAEDEAGEGVEGAKDEAGEHAEGATDEAGEGVEGAKDEAAEGEAGEGVEDDAEDATGQEALDGAKIPEGLPIDLSVMKGLEVNDDGNVYDSEGNAVGTLAEGDAEDLAGYPIGDDGEILDDDGDLVGRCELLPEEIKKQMEAAKERGEELPEGADEYLDQLDEGEEGEGEDEEEEEAGPALPGLEILNGLTCQIDGLIYDADGNTVGKVVDGDPEELKNATLNEQGEFIDEEGNVVGHAVIHEDAADLVEQGVYEAEAAPEGAEELTNGVGEDGEGAPEDAEAAVDGAEEPAVDGAEDTAEGAEKGADDIEDELPGIEDQLPGIGALEGKELNEAGEVVDDQGDVLARIEDEGLKQKIADGEIDPATLHIDDEGQVVDEDGNVLGGDIELAEGAAEKLRGGPVLDPRILDGKKVNKKGEILNEDGELIGELRDGEISDCAGKKVNDKLEVVDKDGKVVGHVNVVPGEAAETATKELLEELGEAPQEVPAPDLPGLDILDGLKVNKKGQVLDEDGEPIGELVDGELSDCAGKKCNEKGEVLDKEGKVIGRVRTLPPPGAEEEAEEEVPEEAPQEETAPGIEVLEGRKVGKKGKVVDDDGEPIGELADGELSDCAGKKINEKGEVLDDAGNVIGHVKLLPQEGDEEEAPKEEAAPGIEVLEGRKVNKKGQVVDDEGEPVGELTDGELSDCAGKKINDKGEVLDDAGNVIGHVQLIPQEGEEEDAVDEGPQLPPLSVLEGLACNKAGKLVDDNGVIVGELVEGDPKKLAKSGLTADSEGQFWDNKGHVIGRAQTVEVEDAEEESPFAGLEGLHVVADGFVEDEEGNKVGVITEGDPKKLVGRAVDEDGDIIDKKGSVVGHAERYEEPEQDEEAPPEEVDLSFLQGKTVNKAGLVIGDQGIPVARLIEGKAKDLAGKQLDDQGQIWNDQGKVIGRVELIPDEEREAKPEGPFAGLEGLRVIEGGKVADEDGNVVGEIVEGNPKRLIGNAVDEDGDILDKYGNVKGHADPLPEVDDEVIDNSLLNGKKLNKNGFVVDEQGVPVGRLIEGDAAELAGRFCDENGDIHNDTGKVVGHCDVIPENERVHRGEGPFAGLEGLRVVKDGWVEDEDGNVVGQLVEGNPKRLVGMSVDEDGDIIDKYGNVKGHADPWEAEDAEAVDLSALAGTTINKHGNAVDGNGQIIGRVVEGDVQSMIGKKVDGEGQIWDNAGNVVGRCELVYGEDTSAEGPFAGFEGLQIQKDGTITTPAGDIVGQVIEGDIKKLMGHTVDEDGDIVDKNGNTIGKAERWEPEEKERRVNPMSGMRVNKEGEVRDENGDLVGKLTEGDLGHCVGQEIDDSGNVVDVDGNKIGECTLLENINEEEYVGPTEEELEAARIKEEEREVAEKMGNICTQTLERMQPICKQIKEFMDKADRTPKEELDEEELVNQVKPLIEESGRILQECNGSLRGLDPDGRIAAQAKGRAGTKEATPEEYRLAEVLKELTTTVVTTVDDAKKKLNDMPYAKKKLNPLWGLMTQPLFQILAAVGLLLAGVLGLVGQLLNGLGLGGLVNGILGGLGIDKLLESFGIGGGKKEKKKGGSALSSLPLVGGMLGGK
ncbi:hypothetical protein LTR36_003178 [Oleoguttula mirabilis]|uniref:DUF6987 domain-containing protein n=1 Tax=Oleoguttula mirabilis TaxID=1507867 RepID=A0AAV9JYQ8_9PEZI|nr:hypothetical protein LTR36_003178 [Oleoguttula mirabilis]